MSSSFVVASHASDLKKDDTLIIVVNDDGTISVDQETLQNLIMNQADAKVSVVRVGQSDEDTENGDLTLTVDPPPVERNETVNSVPSSVGTADVAGLVDPFMEMDPEQLEKLETALQSEQAKQILGENVTAMLDMLTVEEQQKSIKYCIELDHCYTTRTSPVDPEPTDPLPIADSPDIADDYDLNQHSSQQPSSAILSTAETTTVENATTAATTSVARSKHLLRNTATRSVVSRGRKIVTGATQSPTGTKTCPVMSPRNSCVIAQQSPTRGTSSRTEPERKESDSTSTSSESSESEPPSDDDSDFGPRGPRRGGLRARGGRKGLTTRGGSTNATRRRSANKQMDMDQVRRLDMEMAAAVVAMKSPEKSKRPERFNPVRTKKRTKSATGRKKEDVSPSRGATSPVTRSPPMSPAISEPGPTHVVKPFQTTNLVKANLINANMIKGDMILTKPGQARNNQKVLFVQKKVMVKPNEMRTFGIKRQSLVLAKGGKTVPLQIQTKVATSEEGRLVPVGGKTIPMSLESQQTKSVATAAIVSPIVSSLSSASPPPILGLEQQQHPPRIETPPSQLPQQLLQHEQPSQEINRDSVVAPSPPFRTKTTDVKREKRKSESEAKLEDVAKPTDIKTTPDVLKKHLKKEQRKAPIQIADSLGPALFSTPDIIRRVGSEARSGDPTPTTPHASLLQQDSTSNAPIAALDFLTTPAGLIKSHVENASNIGETQVSPDAQSSTDSVMGGGTENEGLSRARNDAIKTDSKVPTVEELEPSLDPATSVTSIADTPELVRSTGTPVPNEIVTEQSGIEGEEHLLATLEMEAGKHDEELLAEALLLQEELGVDLADHTALTESASSVAGPSLSTSTTLETPMEASDRDVDVATVAAESVKSPDLLSVVGSTGPHASVTTVAKSVAPSPPAETPKKQDDKEPIQIIRGGRVITLPPIEAPATRSKRLQAKPETLEKFLDLPKKEDKLAKQCVVQHQTIKEPEEPRMERAIVHDENNDHVMNEDGHDDDDEDDDEDEDEEEENSDSEDDPDRLWCICKRPHNNRFMICCDVCEDWFHGKCVHVSKAMGQQMEEKGIEWVCPNCIKKKDQGSPSSDQKRLQSSGKVSTMKFESERSPRVASPHASIAASEKVRKPSSQPLVVDTPSPDNPTAPITGVTQCVVCKKVARNSSIYCSDACILAHAQETLTRDSKPSTLAQTKVTQGPSDATPKTTTDARVIVFEKRSGKVLTGADAPTRTNLKNWLKENPTFEVVRPNNLNTLQIGGKTVTAIQTQGVGKLVRSSQGTTSGVQGKMVYTKVMGSKQTVLAPSTKKLVVLSGGQQRLSPKTTQQKSQGSPSAGKSPVMRQTTIKIVSQLGKSSTTPTSKQPTAKKQEVAKVALTSQQQQSQQQQQPQQQQQSQQQQQQQKTVQKTPPAKKVEPEPIRLNVRKTLAELLTTRIRDSKDLSLSDEEINELALSIELELYKYFRDTGAKYKSKYRSLVFNIKDTKNLTLFRKIADRSLTPDAVVRLSPDEMASQELAEWRENETKHQLEMIKKNELDLMSQAKSIVVKTHKGELIIENETGIDRVDPKTPVQDIVTALNSHEAGNEENNEDGSKTGNSLSSEDSSKWCKSGSTGTARDTSPPTEERKKRDRERERDKERGDSKSSSKSTDKEGDRATRAKRNEDEERRRSHSRGPSHRSKDRSRDRSSRSKEGKRDSQKEGKDRERHKSGKESRQRDKDRERRSRGKKDRRSRGNREEAGGRKRETSDRKNEPSGQQPGNGDNDAKPIEDRLWRHIEEENNTTTITTPTTTTTTSTILDGNDSDVSDREPSSTVNIKTPDINDESEREKEPTQTIGEPTQLQKQQNLPKSGPSQTVWRGFVNMVDVAKFFITAQEVSGQAKDLMEDLPDTVDVVGRISHETVWDYISKMKKTGSKEILVIRLTAANDEEKIPYITLYSYLNSRSRLGVVGNVSKNIKDFYIMPFSRQSQIPAVLLPLVGPGFEHQRPHLLLGIIVRNKRKRVANVSSPVTAPPPSKIMKKDEDEASLDTINTAIRHPHHHLHHHQSPPDSPRPVHKGLLLESLREKQVNVTQMTLETLNKAHVGMSRGSIIDNATISKLVPELSSKIDLSKSPEDETTPPLSFLTQPTTESTADGTADEDDHDDGDEPYSPGGATDVDEPADSDDIRIVKPNVLDIPMSVPSLRSPTKNSTELQRKMDELNRQIEEQKQQIQNISSSFLGDAASTLPGLGLDPPEVHDSDEAYSPTDARSFTPPPPGINKFAQPILDKVSDITIPPNLQEILANVKRQESSKVDPYLPSKPSATFLTSASSAVYPVKSMDKYTPTFINKNTTGVQVSKDSSSSMVKETKSTLRSLSDLDLIKKAEEELAAVAAAAAAVTQPVTIFPKIDAQSVPVPPPSFSSPPPPPPPPPIPSSVNLGNSIPSEVNEPALDSEEKATGGGISSAALEQPKPPGLEDEDMPDIFPTTLGPTGINVNSRTPQKFVAKSGVVLSVKRKVCEGGASSMTPIKTPRTKSRWGQGPAE